jgi:DNA (cytosine-5)-methyltransferase 1
MDKTVDTLTNSYSASSAAMTDKLTMLSLFSGGGMFDLAAEQCGIETVAMSEVEPFPIAVTRRRFPNAAHLGDINKIGGSKITPVDIVCGGFCCQDLSCAGKMAGLHGERSGLFFQMTRIIREMMAATNNALPRYLIFENVPGLLSSAKGADFREVMDEIASLGFIADANILDAQEFGVAQRRKRVFIVCVNRNHYNPAEFADVPNCRDKRMQKVLDAWNGETFHGIASRPHEVHRRKLSEILESNVDEKYYLTAAACLGILRRVDAKGKEIPQLLRSALEQQAGLLSDNPNKSGGEPVTFEAGATARLPSGKYWSDIAPTIRRDPGDNTCSVAIPLDLRNATRNGGTQGAGVGANGEPSFTLTAERQHGIAISNHPNDSRIGIDERGLADCLTGRAGTGGGNVPLVLNQREQAMTVSENIANTQSATQYKAPQAVCVQGSIIGRKPENGAMGKGVNEDLSFTLDTHDTPAVAYSMTTGSFTQVNKEISPTIMNRDYRDPPLAFGIDRAACNQGANALYKPQIDVEGIHSLTAQGPGAVSAPPSYVVRRLTPSECLVLMGLPRDYCANLGIAEPTEEDIQFWAEVFETHRNITGKSSKPKTRNQIVKFLKNPYSDSACYRMAGNGAVVSVARWIMEGIVSHARP